MIDVVVGIGMVALLIRGWVRGLVREVLDFAGLVLGVIVAFRMSGPFGDFLAERFDFAPELARLGAGLVLMLVVGSGMGLLAHGLGMVARLPGLSLPNRMLGAAFSGLWGVLLILVVVSLLRLVPAVDDTLEGSVVGTVASGPVASAIVGSIVGDDVLDAVLSLESRLGARRVVLEGDDRVEIDRADPDELTDHPGDAESLYLMLNETRLDEGQAPVAWSSELAGVALGHAREMYLDGYVSHFSPVTGRAGDRVVAAGLRFRVVGENLALAASARSIHAGFLESPGHHENLVRAEFDQVGIAAVAGPLGLLVVEVYAGS